MKKILFVVNPISGGIDKSDLKNELTSCCNDHSIAFDWVETTGENDVELISEKIKEAQPQVVVACGGDGTINLVAQVLLGGSLKLGIIPLGSSNGLASELLIPRNIKKAFNIILKDNVLNIDVLRVNDEYISLHLSDVGFNAKLVKNFDAGNSRGKLAYAAHFFKVLFKKAPSKYTFIQKERKFRRRAEMVVFANASRYGTGAVVNPDGCLFDKKFEVCIFKPYPWYAIFRLAFDFFTGGVKRSPYVKIFSAKNIVVKSVNMVPLQIDGEVIGEFKQVTVSLDANQLPLIVPEEFK